MKPSLASIVKFAIFGFVGIAFAGSLVVYSNSRGTHPNDKGEYVDNVTSSGDNEPSRRYEKTFSVEPGGTVKVEADAGTINIDSWDKNEVNVVVEIDGSDSRVEKYTVDFNQVGNVVTIVGKVRDRSFFRWDMGNLSARYTIYTPKQFSSKVKTSGGDVDTKNLSGTIDLSTSGGNVSVEKIEGPVYASTSGGNINADDVKGDVDVSTSGGNIRCSDITGNFKGETSGGDVIATHVDGKVNASTSGGSIELKVTGENKGIDAETSGGGIDIYVKENITADIDAQCSGGDVDCDLPVVIKGRVRHSELRGKVNGGGNLIHAETSGGGIRIAVLR